MDFPYSPGEHEAERASNSYLMSLIAVMSGLPLPIINLLASLIFFLGNRKGSYFIRWHCTQALLSQLSLLAINSTAFWWIVGILTAKEDISSTFIAYLLTALLFNLAEFVSTVYAAIQTRKGKHVSFWFFGPLTQLLVKPKLSP
jgi:uncharacterized Tic20 family protein